MRQTISRRPWGCLGVCGGGGGGGVAHCVRATTEGQSVCGLCGERASGRRIVRPPTEANTTRTPGGAGTDFTGPFSLNGFEKKVSRHRGDGTLLDVSAALSKEGGGAPPPTTKANLSAGPGPTLLPYRDLPARKSLHSRSCKSMRREWASAAFETTVASSWFRSTAVRDSSVKGIRDMPPWTTNACGAEEAGGTWAAGAGGTLWVLRARGTRGRGGSGAAGDTGRPEGCMGGVGAGEG